MPVAAAPTALTSATPAINGTHPDSAPVCRPGRAPDDATTASPTRGTTAAVRDRRPHAAIGALLPRPPGHPPHVGRRAHRLLVATTAAVAVAGVLGLGTTLRAPVVAHAASPTVTFTSGAGENTPIGMAVTSDGKAWFWGKSKDTTGTQYAQPIVIPMPVTASRTSVAPGGAAILATDGSLWSWDLNPADSAVKASGYSNVVQISGNECTLYAVKSDGTLWYTGRNFPDLVASGTCNSTASAWSNPPQQFPGLTGVTKIAVGNGYDDFAIVLKSDHTVWAFGDDNHAEMGDMSACPSSGWMRGLTQVGWSHTFTNATDIAAGTDAAAALENGNIYTWGDNTQGQRGDGVTDSFCDSDQWQLPNVTGFTAIAAGNNSGYATKADGTLWAWGATTAAINSYKAAQIPGPSGVTALSAGYSNWFVIAGGNAYGAGAPSGTGSTSSDPTQITFNDPVTNPCTAPVYCRTTVNVDNVKLSITTPVLPDPAFTASLQTDATQAAVSATSTPYNELTVLVVPYGQRPGADQELPTAQAGITAAYLSALGQLRHQEGGVTLPAPVATLFGQQVQAISNLVPLNLNGGIPAPVSITEWVVEIGQRVWIFRLAQVTLDNPLFTPPSQLIGVSAAADGPMNPDNPGNSGGSNGYQPAPSGIPFPYWWNGQQCDDSYYYVANSIHPTPMAQWDGLTACKPRPYSDHVPDVARWFTDQNGNRVGQAAENEWECTELSKRWLWLAFGIAPRIANGSTMVSAYSGASGLTVVPNGSGVAPSQGDVLSWGPSNGTGHTAVVSDASHVDPSTGNGYITIIEQNDSANGTATVNVSNFFVAPRAGASNGWLHHGPPPTGYTANGRTSYAAPCVYGSSTTVYHGGPNPAGYWLVGSDGGVFSIGSVGFYGSMGGKPLNAPVVGMARTPSAQGYWLVASDGGIFAFGDAHFYGSMGGQHLNACVVGMAATPDGGGYWLVAADGGIFTFGDAAFYGSTGNMQLNAKIVGMAGTPDGHGYWLLGADGGVFTFGDAAFQGAATNDGSPRPFISMSPTPSGHGYWLANTNGEIYSFGDASYMGGVGTDCNCIGTLAATQDGGGYFMLGYNGITWAFGNAYNRGGFTANPPFVGMAVSA